MLSFGYRRCSIGASRDAGGSLTGSNGERGLKSEVPGDLIQFKDCQYNQLNGLRRDRDRIRLESGANVMPPVSVTTPTKLSNVSRQHFTCKFV